MESHVSANQDAMVGHMIGTWANRTTANLKLTPVRVESRTRVKHPQRQRSGLMAKQNVSLYRAMHHLNKGGLHRALGIPEGQKIPADRLEAAKNSKNEHVTYGEFRRDDGALRKVTSHTERYAA
jgi:hypothetical protein